MALAVRLHTLLQWGTQAGRLHVTAAPLLCRLLGPVLDQGWLGSFSWHTPATSPRSQSQAELHACVPEDRHAAVVGVDGAEAGGPQAQRHAQQRPQDGLVRDEQVRAALRRQDLCSLRPSGCIHGRLADSLNLQGLRTCRSCRLAGTVHACMALPHGLALCCQLMAALRSAMHG